MPELEALAPCVRCWFSSRDERPRCGRARGRISPWGSEASTRRAASPHAAGVSTASPDTCRCSSGVRSRRSKASSAAMRPRGRGACCAPAGSRRMWPAHPGAHLYEVALGVPEALQDRRPEVEALRALGYVCLALGEHAGSARSFPALAGAAEAEFDQAGATAASEGWVRWPWRRDNGAARRRGTAGTATRRSRERPAARRPLERQLGVLARKQRDLAAPAICCGGTGALRSGRLADEMARVLNEQGQLDAQLGRYTAASAAYREALPGRKEPRAIRAWSSPSVSTWRSWTSRRADCSRPRRSCAARSRRPSPATASVAWALYLTHR